jgi:hypothetical protein
VTKLLANLALTCTLLPAIGMAQSGKLNLPDFRALSHFATDTTNINLGPLLLHTAAFLIDDKDPDSAGTKQVLASLESVQIRSYQFTKDYEYPREELEAVKRQLAAPGWTPLVQTHSSKGEDVDIYLMVENDQTTGLALISREPKEFTIINIVGSIRFEDLHKLQNQLHIPARALADKDTPSAKPTLAAAL